MRTIISMKPEYLQSSLELVEKVFTEHENANEGKLVRSLVEEIRGKRFYVPELELVMVDEADQVIGFVMFSRFHLEGKYERELLLLSPVAVKTELQRQHIFTHIRWDMRGYFVEVAAPEGEYLWLTAEEIETKAALPTAFRQFWEERNHV